MVVHEMHTNVLSIRSFFPLYYIFQQGSFFSNGQNLTAILQAEEQQVQLPQSLHLLGLQNKIINLFLIGSRANAPLLRLNLNDMAVPNTCKS